MSEAWNAGIWPATYSLRLQTNTTLQESPITRKRRKLVRPGRRWAMRVGLTLVGSDSGWVDGLLDRLAGPSGTVDLWDFARPEPLGPNLDRTSIADTRFGDSTTFTDGTLFDGGAAGRRVWRAHVLGSEEVLVDGFPANTTQLLAGDNVGIGGWLYRLREDADADVSGQAVLYLNRPLRAAASDLAVVTTTRPTSPFELVDDDQAERQTGLGGRQQYELNFVEAL
jgi:hypothetical protein